MRISLRATKNWASTPQRKPGKPPAPMSTEEFRWLCVTLKIVDNETAAELFGISWRTAQRYWYGEILPPDPLARLIRAAVRHNLTHKDLRALSTKALDGFMKT